MNLKIFDQKNIIYYLFLVLFAALFCLYILPFVVVKDSIYIHVHDNLDSVFLYYHHLANSGNLFPFTTDTTIPNVMNGLSIYCFPSCFFIVLLYNLFGSLAGYIINDIIVHIIGFIGMYLLLKKYFITEPQKRFIVLAISFSFAMVPFESGFGISVSGQPLLLFSFLNILNNKQKIQDYILLIIFAFYEWLAMAGVFSFVALILLLFVDTIIKKKINFRFLISIILFIIICFGAEYRLLHGIFFSDFISHRTEWGMAPPDINMMWVIKKAGELLFKTQYHSGYFKTQIIIFAFIIASFLSYRYKRFNCYKLWWIPFLITLICFFNGFYPFIVHTIGFGSFVPFLKTFQGNRFYFLLPILWFLLFAVSLNEISRIKNMKPIIIGLLIFNLCIVGLGNKDYQYNIRQLYNYSFGVTSKSILPNFKQFFSKDLFLQIKNYIGMPFNDYRVVSIGMHPSIAQYNGFYTLDSYQSIYPLEYKHKFRRVIEKELEKSEYFKRYFDSWGSRCYIFASECQCYVSCYNDKKNSINNLEINTMALKDMGCEYILSAVSINNYDKLNLSFEKLFEDKNSCWEIYLYRIKTNLIDYHI